MTTLNQKVCIVTGGGSGIGRATVLAMAGLGARVAVVGRTRSKLDEVVREVGSVGGSARAYVADVSDWDAVATMTADVIERWERLDVLVNNAGSNVRHRGVLDTTPEEIERLIAINLTGTIFCTKAALPRMLEQGAGSIVNVSSMAALRPGMMSGVAYGASKAGVNNFNQFLNDELQHTGVRACVISPGGRCRGRRSFPPAAGSPGCCCSRHGGCARRYSHSQGPD